MTGNTQFNVDDAKAGQIKLCDRVKGASLRGLEQSNPDQANNQSLMPTTSVQESATGDNVDQSYWQMRYESLKKDYDHLHTLNQNLEEKLLKVVEVFEKKKEELVANAEFEKSTLMADVNKLSTKLVDARMKLHDREEKEVLHAAECSAPCHSKTPSSQVIPIAPTIERAPSHGFDQKQKQQMMNDPNLV